MLVMFLVSFFFFFKQKTSYEMRISDWSSDVCSSDLYGRVLVERVEGFATEAEWRKGYDEINEFEAQLTGSRTNPVKLFIHVTQAEQDKRLADRPNAPWKRWKTGTEDYRNRARRADYLDATHAMFRPTDPRWAPLRVIDGTKKPGARLDALPHDHQG